MSECDNGGCGGDEACDGEVKAEGFADIPFASLKVLLDMISGASEFDLSAALDAVKDVADYVMSLPIFDAASAYEGECLEGALKEAVALDGAVSAAGIGDGMQKMLFKFIIEKALAWLAEQVK